MFEESDFLALSGIQHFCYCRRQWALIHIARCWEENERTFKGQVAHQKAHDACFTEKRKDALITRSLPVCSRELGYSGNCDVVEFHLSTDGVPLNGRSGMFLPVPVEYKSGMVKDSLADKLQLTAEAMAIEEMMLVKVPVGYLYYKGSNKRVQVEITDELRRTVTDFFAEMHNYFSRGYIPKVKKSNKCLHCSLYNHCFVDLFQRQKASQYNDTHFQEMENEEASEYSVY